MTPKEMQLHAVLTSRHAIYKKKIDEYNLFQQVYSGGVSIRERLVRHTREHEESYALRKSRAYFLNYCQAIIDQYVSYIYRKQVIRTVGTGTHDVEIQDEFYKDADLSGNTIHKFMKSVARHGFTFGHIHVLVDTPNSSAVDIKTEQQRQDAGHRPFLSIITPANFVNWALDRHGKFLWVRWVEDIPDDPDAFKVPDDRSIPSRIVDPRGNLITKVDEGKPKIYKTWTKDKWFIHEIRGREIKLIDSAEHSLGEVPIVTIYNVESTEHKRIGLSMLVDIAWMNLAIFNWMSLLDEELHQKTFNILTMQQSVGQDAEEIVIGSNNVLTYTGNIPPNFIFPSTAPAGQIISTVNELEDKIFKLSKLGGISGNIQRQSQSGIAHAFTFNETNQALVDRANNLETGEKQIHRLYWKWLGQDWTGNIDYPEEFGVELFEDELKESVSAKETVQSMTFRKEIDQRLAKKFIPKADKSVVETVMKEIEEFYKKPQPNAENQSNEENTSQAQEAS